MYLHMITSAPWVMYPEITQPQRPTWRFREPSDTDGDQIFQLIKDCPPLDVNSSYCNFLQSTHFADTCILVEIDDEVAGFISAYRKPQQPDVLFVWQVAVSSNHRGKGIASKMLDRLLARDTLSDINAIETMITKNNTASWMLFEKLDKRHGKRGEISVFLDQNTHFKGEHDTEYLYRIPLSRAHAHSSQ